MNICIIFQLRLYGFTYSITLTISQDGVIFLRFGKHSPVFKQLSSAEYCLSLTFLFKFKWFSWTIPPCRWIYNFCFHHWTRYFFSSTVTISEKITIYIYYTTTLCDFYCIKHKKHTWLDVPFLIAQFHGSSKKIQLDCTLRLNQAKGSTQWSNPIEPRILKYSIRIIKNATLQNLLAYTKPFTIYQAPIFRWYFYFCII